ncbi:MAG TPA: endonuclease/exonuclease/phosphatase family protein [Longimicrobiales bacterium]|nr:endonuclease/exonuclease/phosphatase family protein [Longimicrobiales bacterium]
MRRRGEGPRAFALALLVVACGCNTGLVYPDPVGPRFFEPLPGPPPEATWRDTLLVVSFNVENSQEIDSALAVLTTEPDLSGPDIVLLQEVDEHAARRMAAMLSMGFIYYPAILRKATGRNFGNAVLSRWPVVDDEKLILPHLAIFGRTQRIATAATVQVGSTAIRVYSVHLATPPNLALPERQDQMRAVLRDAARHPHVIIGGDLNGGSLGNLAVERGFAWPTRDGPRTVLFGRWDHIFFKGLLAPDHGASGTIRDNRGASDHLPVWARGVVY